MHGAWEVQTTRRQGRASTGEVEACLGQWVQAQRLIDEGVELCETHGYELFAWPGRYHQAALAALRGDYHTTDVLTDKMIQWAVPRRVLAVHAYSCRARTLAALGRGDHEEAYRQATGISPAGTLASHVPSAMWAVMDLVEAAVRAGRYTEAATHVAAMREANIAVLSSRLALLVDGSAAIAATDRTALELFEETLAIPGIDQWPFDLARVQLAYGERLRRARAMTQSRVHLTAALDTFQRLGAQPWAARAGNELRATGLSIGQAHTTGPASLTPHQREIATLAAAGLTNKQIGERLFLSPRTRNPPVPALSSAHLPRRPPRRADNPARRATA